MGRYGQDYGREFGHDFGRRDFGGGNRGGAMWQEGRGSGQYGRGYGPDEGRTGSTQSFGGGPYDQGFRDEPGYGGGYGAFQGPRGEYGGRFGGAPNSGFMEGWQDQRGGIGTGSGRQTSNGWGRARAAQIMTENPRAVTGDATLSEVARTMRDLDVGIIPVVDDTESRRLQGVITDRDITVRAIAEGMDGNAKVSECMTDRVRSVNKNDAIQDVMWVMRREQVRRVPVTDREGRLVGIIAQADLAVDYAMDDPTRETQMAETLERVSEPARPHGGRSRLQAD